MAVVTMRELKQNPQEVVALVLTENVARQITSHGRQTGVVIQPAQPARRPQRFVPGAILNQIGADWKLTLDQVNSWCEDIDSATDDELSDPWDQAQP